VEAGTSQALVIEREVHVDASRDTVFEFFTDPAKMVRWMGVAATIDPRPGGAYRIDINSYIAVGEFTEVDHPSRIVMTWGWESHPELAAPGSSVVTVDLTEHGGGTLVRLTHTGLAGPAIAGHSDGWDKYMPRLAIAAAGGDPGPDPDPTKED